MSKTTLKNCQKTNSLEVVKEPTIYTNEYTHGRIAGLEEAVEICEAWGHGRMAQLIHGQLELIKEQQ